MAKRVSGGFDKKIFGVPVFPVMKAGNNNNGNHSNDHGNEHNINFNNANNIHANNKQGYNANNPTYNNNNNQAYNPPQRNSSTVEKRNSDCQNNAANNNYKQHSNNFPSNNYSNNTSNNINNINNNTSLTNQWKLRHIDFMPANVKNKKEEEFEKFSMLVDRANDWSLSNHHVIVFSCETVTWTSVDKPLYTDTAVMVRSMTSDRRTKFLRGLRLWYFIFEEVFVKHSSSIPRNGGVGSGIVGGGGGGFKLGHVTYTCDVKGETSFSQLLKKLNADLARKAIKGKILRIETLELLNDVADPEACVWYEHPEKARDYTWFVRVLIACDAEEVVAGEIGVHDFIPVLDHRSPHNAGYETYEDLWRKASNHIYHNPQMTFICMQSVFVKVKKDTETSSMTLWDKCTHCQHGSSYGSLSNQRTEFLQILRLTFYKSEAIGPGRNAPPTGLSGKKLFYKYFSACPMKRPLMSPGASPSDDQDPMTVDCLYEDLKDLEDKINSWLAFSGAKVAGVETLMTRLGSGGQEMLASEATSVYNQRERNLTKEPWRVTIRLVLEGEFREMPLGWENFSREARSSGGSIRSDF